MTSLDYVAIGLLAFIALLALAVAVALAAWPGRVAAARRHPHAEAVAIGGWATLLFGGIFWPLVLMWAYAGGSGADERS